KRPRDARLLAPEHLESERERRREVVAREACIRGDVALGPALRVEHDREADVADQAPLVGDHEVPAGAQHPRELAERSVEARALRERDRADDEVDRVVRKRQLVKVGLMELALRDPLSRAYA